MVRPECELIIQCVRACELEQLAGPVRAWAAQVEDWDSFMSWVRRHQIRPLIYNRLKKICPDAVPDTVIAELSRSSYQSAVYNLRLLQELARLVTLLKEHGIPAISFKGPLQASAIYGGLGVREISDLDILVHQEDVLKVKEIMLANGYLSKWVMNSNQEQDRIHGHAHYDYPFISQNGEVVVEVHWNLLPENSTFNLKCDFLWEKTASHRLAKAEVDTFPPSETFLFLCIHNEQHNWRAIKFIADAAFLLKSCGGELDWDYLLEKARLLDHYESVLLTALLASRVLDGPIPQKVEALLSRRADLLEIAALMRARLFADGFNLPWIPGWLEGLSLIENRSIPASGLQYVKYFPKYVRAILTPERIDRVLFPPLPKSLSFLYCGARILRFIGNKVDVHLPTRKPSEVKIK